MSSSLGRDSLRGHPAGERWRFVPSLIAMEEKEEEEEEEEEEEQPIPPIATTPPRGAWKESSSCSSSESQASGSSGISLGEAIRQTTAAPWGIESWYQIPAEVDSSHFTAASQTKLGLTCDRSGLTEFPTLEEGVIPSAEASRRQAPGDAACGLVLDLQDSQVSPHLPLLMTAQSCSDETLLQQSAMDFIALRGVPDVSGASEESPTAPSPSFTLSQHPLPFGPGDTHCGACFSGPTSSSVSKEGNEDCANKGPSVPQARDGSANATSTASLPRTDRQAQVGASPAKQPLGTAAKDEHCSWDSVPLTVSELSEKEKGWLRLEESSESSSGKPALAARSDRSAGEMCKGRVSEGGVRQPGRLEKQEKPPELDLSNHLPADLRKKSWKNAAAPGVFAAGASGTSREGGEDFSGLENLKLLAVAEELQGASLDPQQKQLSPAAWTEKEQLLPAVRSTTSKQLAVGGKDSPPSRGEGTPVEAEAGMSRSELTVSDLSIERGHKVTSISPSFNLVGDGSFSVHLAHPNYQSTPGILLNKNVKAEELGGPVIKSDAQGSPLCSDEAASGSSAAGAPACVEKQHSPRGAQKQKDEGFELFKWKSPHRERIQSLPSLSFMEKVGTWNMSQKEEVSDAGTSPGGASPARKTSSAITGSSNKVLAGAKSSRGPGGDIAASSGVTGSLRSWSIHKNFLVQPLTRSQSDNTVNVSTQNLSLAQVLSAANSTEAAQPPEEKTHGLGEKNHLLGVSPNSLGSSMRQKFPAELVSGSSPGQSSDPKGFVLGADVAQLLPEGGNSPPSDQKNGDAPENQPHNQTIPAGCVHKGHLSDISPASLNPVSYGERSQGGLSSAGLSSVVSRHLFSAKGDDFIPLGVNSVKTPEKEELNIEERIPIYLQNLGIHQSPGTILTPFAPQGPIREVEFSPSELRTLKDSTETPAKSLPQPRGRSLSADETTLGSLHFGISTLSSSVPTASGDGSDILSLHDLSPSSSRAFGHQALSQCHPPEKTTLCSTQGEELVSDTDSPMLLMKRIQDLGGKNEAEDVNSPQRWAAGSSAGVRNEAEVGRGSPAPGGGSKRIKEQQSGSVVGSSALEEILKLLGEVKGIAGVWDHPVPPSASSGEAGEPSGVLNPKEGGLGDPSSAGDSLPQLEKGLPKAEPSSSQRNVQEEGSVRSSLNYNRSHLRWEKASDVGLHPSQEMLKETTKSSRPGGRSEPEGCSSVTADRNQPALVGLAQSKASSEVSTLRTSELGNPFPPPEPGGSGTNISGAFQSFSKGSLAGSKTGGVRERDNSSSGDSLAAHIKNLPRHPPSSEPLNSIPRIPGGFQRVLPKASAGRREAGGGAENNDSSSGDSIAARVKNLLRKEPPVAPALKNSAEEERKSQVWVKLKLSSQSQEALADWTEEYQPKLEEIKAELLLRAKKSTPAKDPQVAGSEGYSHRLEQDLEHLKAPSDQRYQPDRHIQATRMKELVESSLGEAVPFPRADPSSGCLLKETQFPPPNALHSPLHSQHQVLTTGRSDTAVEPHHPPPVSSGRQAGVHFPGGKELAGSAAGMKQISSITFSSQKHLQVPLASLAPSSWLSGHGLDGIMPLEADSASPEEESSGKQHCHRSKSWPSSPVLAGSVSSPAEEHWLHPVSAAKNRAAAYQETHCLSAQDSVSIHADEKQTFSAKNSAVLPQDVPELGRPSANLDCDVRLSQETSRGHELHPRSSSQQEKSSPARHTQLGESLAGSDLAIQTDVLKGHVKSVEEKKSSSDKAPLLQEAAAREQTGMSQPSPTYEISSTTSVAPSTPIKKALSCVHITLSSKCNSSGLQSDLNAEGEVRWRDKKPENTQPTSSKPPGASIEAASKASAADFIPGDQRSSSYPSQVSLAGPCQVLSSDPGLQSTETPQLTALGAGGCSLKKIIDSTVPPKPGKKTSDATTQITTESPEKITFSAEIYVNSQTRQDTNPQPSLQRAQELPNNTTSAPDKTSAFTRQGDQPLLLPYKPSGSSGMYYVPYLKTAARTSPVASEASHSGSDDALPPRSPANLLGLRDENPAGSTAGKKQEGIYRRAKPKLAWAEEQMGALEASSEHADHWKHVKTTQPAFRSSQSYLRGAAPTCESSLPSTSELSEDTSAPGPAASSPRAASWSWKKPQSHRPPSSARAWKGGETEFFLLAAEADHSRNEELHGRTSLGNQDEQELLPWGRRGEQKAAGNPSPCKRPARLNGTVGKDLPGRQRSCSNGSLDELWVKFLECRRRHQHHDSRRSGELSLVERLERLARVLQNPVQLVPAKSTRGLSEKQIKGREEKKVRVTEKSLAAGTLEPHSVHLEGKHLTRGKDILVELRRAGSGEKTTARVTKTLEKQDLETPGDTSSEAKLSRGDGGITSSSISSEWDVVTQTEVESSHPERSSSVSTIDTARLIRAFGQHRVQVSPRLSQLYCTIHQQKNHSEKWEGGSGKAKGVEYPKGSHGKRKEMQKTISFSSDSASSSSWGPSSALSSKRRARMLNKGVQAGDLEIISSATRKNTRDVGVTFPTPGCRRADQRPQEAWRGADGISGESDGMDTAQQAAARKGVSWLVQAEDLKWESRKENHSHFFGGPGPSWFEPWSSTKAWREPLREKNWQEQQSSPSVHPAGAGRAAENRAPQPFVKLTLQEALAVHRPDFISRSGERLKHLKDLMEERRIQNMLQSQQQELLNPPGNRKGNRNTNHVQAERGFQNREKRTIPKSEMVQRSKRIYEQLPEVRKKREEEKRKLEYRSYRLKAQLYKTKITNRVLGRKVPWN